MQTIGIIGGGAWGTALAQSMASSGKKVVIWAREDEVVQAINARHENTPFLPGIPLHLDISASGDLGDVTRSSDALLMVTPAQYLRVTLEGMKASLKPSTPIVICAKGVEIESGDLMSQIAGRVVPQNPLAVLTGPTFAAEIAKGLPSAVTLAMNRLNDATALAEALNSKNLRMYPADDIVGAQVGGAVKNVIAIACGVIEGKRLGDSARAALVTRGLAEIARLAAAMGAKKETLMGMCGVGDMILTCSSMQSRNFSLGVALGQGEKLADILARRNSVTEGVYTAKALAVMAKRNAVEMPVSDAVHTCLQDGCNVDTMIDKLLGRPIKSEAA